MTRRFSLLLVAGLTTIALAACGGGATPTASSAAAPPSSAPSTAASAPEASAPAGSAAGAACAVAPTGGTATVSVTIKDFKFSPDPIQAKVGDVIGWTNNDTIQHTATLDDNSCTTDALAGGAIGMLTFSAPGTYPYHCKIHPTQMKGTIVVQ
jgi:plastocyanin